MDRTIQKEFYVKNYGQVFLDVSIEKDNDGVFSAIVENLPGCGSCGQTEEEAIKNLEESVSGVIEDYQAEGEEVPWQ